MKEGDYRQQPSLFLFQVKEHGVKDTKGLAPFYLVVSGFALLLLSIVVGWGIVPQIIYSQVSSQIKLQNGTEVWENWKDIPIPVYLKFYIFNVTNPMEVESGAKPILEEKGPYVYREKRTKVDLSLSEDGEIVSYRQKIVYFFEESMSTGAEDDVLTVINVPFVVVTHMTEKISSWLRSMVDLYIYSFEEKLFIKRTVGELLFKGYHQPMMASIEELTGKKILQDQKFGLYYPKNGTDDGIFEVHSGVQDSRNFGEIISWNNKTKLDWWLQSPGDYCNMLNGTDGSIFPPFVTKDRILRIFNPDLCRSLYLTFDHEVEFKGIPGYRFTAPRSMLEDPLINHDNLCFCLHPGKNYEGCLKAGAIPLAACRDGAPVAMSIPHFYEASEEYLNQSIGLNPVKEFHETFVDVELTTGLALRAHKRIQINVELKRRASFDALQDVPEMLFPILWADEFAEIDEANAAKVKDNLIRPLHIIYVIKWGVVGLGILLIVTAAALSMFRWRKKIYHV